MLSHSTTRTVQQLGWGLHFTAFLSVCGGVAAVVCLLFSPIADEREQLSLRHEKASKLLAADGPTRDINTNRQHQLANLQGELTTAVERVPETANDAEFLAQVAEMARESEVSLSQFRSGAEFQQASHTELEIKLSARGTYPRICRFMDALQSHSRLYKVTSLSLIKTATEDVIPVELTLRIFFAPKNSLPEKTHG
ncbi:MAG: type 4a pilus biogenesis protein PilO [Planctomycetota bacterium]|nr:type 4a pilus biogenesis protein PilO [Planctomycetota bacterium]